VCKFYVQNICLQYNSIAVKTELNLPYELHITTFRLLFHTTTSFFMNFFLNKILFEYTNYYYYYVYQRGRVGLRGLHIVAIRKLVAA